MSELNVYHHELRPNEYAEFYLKYEADKVIAEKDAEIARLNAIRKVHTEAIESMGAGLQQDEEEILHQKYKRCLAMAWWCSAEIGMLVSTWESKIKYYKRWQKRWLELAEKFKTN